MEYYQRFNGIIQELFGGSYIPDWHEEQEKQSGIYGKKLQKRQLDESFIRLGDTYVHLKKYKTAMNCFREAFRVNPENIMAFCRLLLISDHFMADEGSRQRCFCHSNESSTLALNDAFRQTFIGGPVILSKKMKNLKKSKLEKVFEILQNLDDQYFQSQGCVLRDHGAISMGRHRFAWMINQLHNFSDVDCKTFPVLIIMTEPEYRKLEVLIHNHIIQ